MLLRFLFLSVCVGWKYNLFVAICVLRASFWVKAHWKHIKETIVLLHWRGIWGTPIYSSKSKYSAKKPFPYFHWGACINFSTLRLLFQGIELIAYVILFICIWFGMISFSFEKVTSILVDLGVAGSAFYCLLISKQRVVILL